MNGLESVCLSNPPFNLKWQPDVLAKYDPRFSNFGVPPKNNANYAFVLSALEKHEKAVFILPAGIANPTGIEKDILKQLIELNWLDAVIALPDRMFESTSIPVCVLVFNKQRDTQKVTMVNLRDHYEEEVRYQNGMFGGKSNTERTYKKKISVIPQDVIDRLLKNIKNRVSEKGFCAQVLPAQIAENDYKITPQIYMSAVEDYNFRPFSDIASDYNRIIKEKNKIKITMNETIAKAMGLYDAYKVNDGPDLSKSFAVVGQTAEKEDFIKFTRNATVKIELKTNDGELPEAFILFMNMWTAHIMYLNREENRILGEFRDALLPGLMSGEIRLPDEALEE